VLSTIIEELEKISLSGWQCREVNTQEYQQYWIRDWLESERTVDKKFLEVRLYKELTSQLQGEAVFYTTPLEKFQIDEKIAQALQTLQYAPNPPFKLPKPVNYLNVSTQDETLASPRERAFEIREKTCATLRLLPTICSSQEIFIKQHTITLINSRGINASYLKTEYLVDCVLLSGSNREVEVQAILYSSHNKDLEIDKHLTTYSQYAADALNASLPATTTADVVIGDQALTKLFVPFIVQSGAEFFYKGISRFHPNKSIYPIPTKGDLLTLSTNPTIPFGSETAPFDNEGVALYPLVIIEDGILKHLWATKRYADYLKINPSGEFSNIEVKEGSHSLDELLVPTSTNPLYYILEFSYLQPDIVSGDFAAEIRIGYQIDKNNGKRKFIKGGSVTGNIFKMFSNAIFSKEKLFYRNYLGPKGIKFHNIRVAGD